MPRSRSDWCGRPSTSPPDRKSTRLNSSHDQISYAVFCLKKKNITVTPGTDGFVNCMQMDPMIHAATPAVFDRAAMSYDCEARAVVRLLHLESRPLPTTLP